MPISLRNSTSPFPYLGYGPQKDRWSVPDNGVAKEIDIIGKLIAMDPENGQIGWLSINNGTRDWHGFAITDDLPERPGPNYKLAFSLLVYAPKALGSPEIHEMCASTSAHNSFCEALYNGCESEFDKGKIPIVKITGTTPRKVGKGSTADIHFEIVKWIERPAAFTEAVARRDEGAKRERPSAADTEDDDFGLNETVTEPRVEPKAGPAPKKTAKKRATKPEPTLSDILDDDIPF
jgi:hypothetical protein